MLRVGRYEYKTKTQAKTDGFTNVLIHTTGSLSPYEMEDKDGCIMENYWQFSKVWDEVPEVHQVVSRYHANQVRWSHPSQVHLKNGRLTPEYWAWRAKGRHHNKWVRYPVNCAKHAETNGSVIGTDEEYELVGYIEARKRICYPKYAEIARDTRRCPAQLTN
jgi:hypothetical protein